MSDAKKPKIDKAFLEKLKQEQALTHRIKVSDEERELIGQLKEAGIMPGFAFEKGLFPNRSREAVKSMFYRK